MNISNTQMLLSPDDIIVEARKWLDTRWVHQGRSKAGIDCAGLLIRVLGDLNLPVEDMQGYRRSPDARAFLDHIRRQTEPGGTPAPGKIAIFRQSAFPCHTGFFATRDGKLSLIHAYATSGKVVEELFIHEWPELLVEVRNVVGVQY